MSKVQCASGYFDIYFKVGPTNPCARRLFSYKGEIKGTFHGSNKPYCCYNYDEHNYDVQNVNDTFDDENYDDMYDEYYYDCEY